MSQNTDNCHRDELPSAIITTASKAPYRSEWEGLADVLFAIAIGLMLAWGLYHYFGG